MDLISTRKRVKKTKTHALCPRSSVENIETQQKQSESNRKYQKLKRFQSLLLGVDFDEKTSPRFSNWSRSPKIEKEQVVIESDEDNEFVNFESTYSNKKEVEIEITGVSEFANNDNISNESNGKRTMSGLKLEEKSFHKINRLNILPS